jgi:hypothetical protein
MKSKKPTHLSLLPPLVMLFVLALAVLVYVLFQQTKPNILGTTNTASTSSSTASIVSIANKELYVPLGTGINATTDWVDVKGAAAYIDTKLYGKFKKVSFEASTSGTSGVVYVRLYNATDKHPVWYSEMNMSGAGPELLVSPAITLDAGNKLYQVQMKSQLGSPTNLLQGRVHIITY